MSKQRYEIASITNTRLNIFYLSETLIVLYLIIIIDFMAVYSGVVKNVKCKFPFLKLHLTIIIQSELLLNRNNYICRRKQYLT